MKGYRILYVITLIGAVTYNALQLVVPHFTQRILDEFLIGEKAHENLRSRNAKRLRNLVINRIHRGIVVTENYDYSAVKIGPCIKRFEKATHLLVRIT